MRSYIEVTAGPNGGIPVVRSLAATMIAVVANHLRGVKGQQSSGTNSANIVTTMKRLEQERRVPISDQNSSNYKTLGHPCRLGPCEVPQTLETLKIMPWGLFQYHIAGTAENQWRQPQQILRQALVMCCWARRLEGARCEVRAEKGIFSKPDRQEECGHSIL